MLLFSAVPSEPRSFNVTTIPGSPRSLSISWVPPDIQNGIIISYAIYCELPQEPDSDMMMSGIGIEPEDSSESVMLSPDNSTELLVVVAGNETDVLFPNLIPYTVYICYASASTSAGEGNFTIEVSARTDESGTYFVVSLVYVVYVKTGVTNCSMLHYIQVKAIDWLVLVI